MKVDCEKQAKTKLSKGLLNPEHFHDCMNRSIIRPTTKEKASVLLEIEGLSYSYKGSEIFKDFSLHTASKIVVLRGASGCGKTTLLKLLSGNLKPDRFISMPPTQKSCLVLQEDSLFPWLTGIENISKLTRLSFDQFQRHPMFELIESFVNRKAYCMSYGKRRMVELFRAIVFQPR